jgi:hypothetical protein
MRKAIESIIALCFFLSVSCAVLVPHTETVIRLPQEHEYVPYHGRIPIIYIQTSPLAYWDFALSFKPADVNGLLMTGEALYATLKEGLSTAFNVTRRPMSGDYRAIVDLDRFLFSYEPVGDGRMIFKASLEFSIFSEVGRKVDTVGLDATTSVRMPDSEEGQVKAAASAFAELLSMMEKELAVHTVKAWNDGRYPI